MDMSRRDLLKTATIAAFALAGNKRSAGADTGLRLFAFNYSDVKLLDGPLQRQYVRTHEFFMNLDENRLLKIYRQQPGLPAPGDDMGGWYDADGYTPGGSIGQYISALARFGNATGEVATRAKVARLVRGFAKTMGQDGNPYANEAVAKRCPGYVMDKHAIGLLDAARLAGTPGCLDILSRGWDYAIKLLPSHAVELWTPEINGQPDETFTLPENLYYAYELSGEQRYRDLARRFLFDDRYCPMPRCASTCR